MAYVTADTNFQVTQDPLEDVAPNERQAILRIIKVFAGKKAFLKMSIGAKVLRALGNKSMVESVTAIAFGQKKKIASVGGTLIF